MPELNLDKIVSSLNLRIDSLETKEDIEELKKDFLGKNSLISEERKKLSSMSNEDKKNTAKN
jgi:phenylalanyl-tRNA synthetase alpha subunit